MADLSPLSSEIQLNLKTISQTDQKLQESEQKLDLWLKDLKIKLSTSGNLEKPFTEASRWLAASQKSCLDLADQKVLLAQKTYELVDNYISKVDKDLLAFEQDIKLERDLLSGASPEQKLDPSLFKEAKSDMKSSRKSSTQSGTTISEQAVLPVPPPPILSPVVPVAEVDLPIDPNEPTFCTCNQVSYGEMVACDYQACKIEWFHFGCVGLKSAPKGKWYCADCKLVMQAKRKNKKK